MDENINETPEFEKTEDAREKKAKGGRTLDSLRIEDEEVKKSYVPEGFDDVDSFLRDMREEYDLDLAADHVNRLEALEDKRFVAGEHWDPAVLAARKGLPNLVINTIPQFTAQLVGDWRQSRNAVKVVPGEDGDTEIASIRSDLIRAIEYQSRANRAYDTAFESNVQCGDGAFRIAVEYANNSVFDQNICVKPIDDALSVIWDRMSIDPTGRDARHCFVDDIIPLKEFKRRWPQHTPSALSENAVGVMRSNGWLSDDTTRVTEFWRLVERDRLLALLEDGSVHFLDKENIEDIVEKHGQPVKTRIAPCTYAQMHLVTGWAILSGPHEWQLSRLPIIRMSGRIVNIDGFRYRYGLTRFMKDPARLRNFWRSIAAEQLGYAPKAVWMAPESAVEGREDQWRNAHISGDRLLVYNDGAETPPQRIDPPVPQMALLNEAQVNTQDMKDVTGIHDASLGIKSNETSGKAIMARQREGDVASITFFDNGNAAVLEGGDVINQLIGQIYDGTRIVRLVGEDEAIKLMKINDPMDPSSPDLSIGQYDTVATTGVSYTTRRAEAAEAMMNAVQVWPNLIGIAGDIIAKAQDWPGSEKLAERLKKTIPPQLLDEKEREQSGAPAITPEQMMELQTKLEELLKENEDLKKNYDIQMYNAETQRIRALSDNMVDGNQMEMDAIKTVLDHSIKLEGVKSRTTAVNNRSSVDKA